jgi:hypothetical protein
MKPITTIFAGLLIASASLPAFADTVFNAAYQAAQENYRGDSTSFLENHNVDPTDANRHLFNTYRNDLNRSGH